MKVKIMKLTKFFATTVALAMISNPALATTYSALSTVGKNVPEMAELPCYGLGDQTARCILINREYKPARKTSDGSPRLSNHRFSESHLAKPSHCSAIKLGLDLLSTRHNNGDF